MSRTGYSFHRQTPVKLLSVIVSSCYNYGLHLCIYYQTKVQGIFCISVLWGIIADELTIWIDKLITQPFLRSVVGPIPVLLYAIYKGLHNVGQLAFCGILLPLFLSSGHIVEP